MNQRSSESKIGGDKANLPPSIIILGIGNILLSDEGVGIHILKELYKIDLPANVQIIDGGTDGFALLEIFSQGSYFFILDAVKGGNPPGTIYLFDLDDISEKKFDFKTSFHQTTIYDVHRLAKLSGKNPIVKVIGIEPASMDIGLELSPLVKSAVPKALKILLDQIKKLNN